MTKERTFDDIKKAGCTLTGIPHKKYLKDILLTIEVDHVKDGIEYFDCFYETSAGWFYYGTMTKFEFDYITK